MKIVVIQGPNLNMLGHRDPRIYGNMKLEQIHKNLETLAKQNNFEIEFFQSNFEGEIVDRIQECVGTADGILINPAAYSHTSIAIADAISLVGIPVVEVHLSNIFARDDFRKKSITGALCAGVIAGFGPFGYHIGLLSIMQIITEINLAKKNEQK
ncbi:type II 3-dehydroquinate dehydratase [Helicobacter sp. MIT 14-3879]|uniref:type II 3-dehydroquinate dehydratase n=1 Tax=Helicobacter sp. MIT 14-3879 TaxID=2040649 RepID=UPI000E1F2CC2|nr:type II 3-dehydroquinate dehydratase [Helicobacter sp. MIT 14-3879]RDU65176.1 type II 3-dehydroquinate dehydratase [Helicobacter sp. MIT 14-3879]